MRNYDKDESMFRLEIVNNKIKIYSANSDYFHETDWELMYEFEVDIDDLIKFSK